ncbi:MAG: hypothetical protein LH471_01655 [Salinibacterium sp.]|nr:hypothetical protein [Salinibacterium sp.]
MIRRRPRFVLVALALALTLTPFGAQSALATAAEVPVLVAPALIAPANTAVIPSTTVVLQWGAVEGARDYELRNSFDSQRDPATGELSVGATTRAGITSTRAAVEGLGADWVWWQVRAVDAAGNAGAWSVAWGLRSSAAASVETLTQMQLPTLAEGSVTSGPTPEPRALAASISGIPLWVGLTAALVALVMAWFVLLWRSARHPT